MRSRAKRDWQNGVWELSVRTWVCEAGDVDDTPDSCPDPIAQYRAEKGAKDIDDPDDNQADACIPETNQFAVLYLSLSHISCPFSFIHKLSSLF